MRSRSRVLSRSSLIMPPLAYMKSRGLQCHRWLLTQVLLTKENSAVPSTPIPERPDAAVLQRRSDRQTALWGTVAAGGKRRCVVNPRQKKGHGSHPAAGARSRDRRRAYGEARGAEGGAAMLVVRRPAAVCLSARGAVAQGRSLLDALSPRQVPAPAARSPSQRPQACGWATRAAREAPASSSCAAGDSLPAARSPRRRVAITRLAPSMPAVRRRDLGRADGDALCAGAPRLHWADRSPASAARFRMREVRGRGLP
jgi:hypothetical protein